MVTQMSRDMSMPIPYGYGCPVSTAAEYLRPAQPYSDVVGLV
jgi:hypothetical protein